MKQRANPRVRWSALLDIMLDILKFIFSSFWVWLGTLILVGAIAEGIGGLIRITINRRRDK